MRSIGARIRAAREAAGMTQTALAQALGAAQQTVAAWERDANAITAVALVQVAEQLHVSPALLLGSGGAHIAAQLDTIDTVRALLDDLETRLRARDQPRGD